ncbi:Inactive histone-lysine N-methyltransferase 2E [Bienertia sinuspersici]
MGSHEPYWRTNTSFSPPPSRWDYGFQSEGMQYGSSESIQLFGSTSSNSKESRSWIRGGYHPSHQYSASEGGAQYFSSPSDASLIQPWTPPPARRISIDDFETPARRDTISGPLSFTPTMEGTSMVRDGGGFASPHSDGSEFEHTGKLNLSTPRNFPSRRSFMSKPIHPLSFPHSSTREASASPAAGFSAYDATTPQGDTLRLSSGSSSIDLTDISERLEPEVLARSSNNAWSKQLQNPIKAILLVLFVLNKRKKIPPSSISFLGYAIIFHDLELSVKRDHQELGVVFKLVVAQRVQLALAIRKDEGQVH